MAAIPLNDSGVRDVKRALTTRFPKDKSSHLSEALAAALGFATSISLASAVRKLNREEPDYALLDEDAFLLRLATVTGGKMGVNDRSLIFDNIRYADGHSIVKTRSVGYRRIKYGKSVRLRAWLNMLIAGINAAIDRRLFTICPGDHRWPGREPDKFGRREPYVFNLEIAGIPALCSVHDAGYVREEQRSWLSIGRPERKLHALLEIREDHPKALALDALFRGMMACLPPPVVMPVNGAMRANEPGYDLGHHGGYGMEGDKVRISARELTEILAGRRSIADDGVKFPDRRAAKVQRPNLVQNMFERKLREGRLPTSITVLHTDEDDSDDWIEFQFGDPDPAISPLE